MEVHFNAETQARIERAASENGSGTDEYVQQLVEHYLDHDEWFRERVKKGIGHLDRGEFITHDEMGSHIAKMFRE